MQNGCSSVRKVSAATGIIPRATEHKILRQKLKMYPYKVQIGQSLTAQQVETRLNFCDWLLAKDMEADEYLENVLWSDEANFYINGWVNRQNMRFWGGEVKTH